MSYVIDQPNCSGCHRCELECPVKALRMKNSKYWIDPEICIGCGRCASFCHNHAIHDPDNPEPQPQPHEKIYRECDVLVIGGGASGLTAGAKAADLGATVVLLEKNWEIGGSAYFGHMMRIMYSKWHAEAGLPDPRQKMYDNFVKKTEGYDVNYKLLKNLLDANSELIDWLIDAGELQKGFAMGQGRFGDPDVVFTYESKLRSMRTDPAIGPGDSGSFICDLLCSMLKERGGEIFLNARAYKLLCSDDGAVVGALARDPGGEIEIRAKSVVIASGAFTRNRELMDEMQPLFYDDEGKEPVHIFTCATCTGDGITMCREIGADIDTVNRRVNLFGPMHHPFSYPVISMTRNPSAVTVDKFGHHMEEFHGMKEVGDLVNAPGRIAWQIIDQRCVDEAVEGSRTTIDPDEQMAFRRWEEELNNEIRDGSTVKAETLEELAEKLNFDSEAFLNFIMDHNEEVKHPHPPAVPPAGAPESDEDDFMAAMMANMPKPHPLENGPFYAVFQKMFHENTVGGMVNDENTSILRNGKPVKGLYGAGDTTRGIMLPGDIGVNLVEGTVSAMTYAMSSGYIAGISSAGYAGI